LTGFTTSAPALLTRMSSRPNARTVSSTAALTAATSAASALIARLAAGGGDALHHVGRLSGDVLW
jgi:hypothetical protein